MDPFLTFLQSYVNEERALQVTAGEQIKADLQAIYCSGHLTMVKGLDALPAITYIDQLCRDTGCLLNDLPALLQDRDRWSDRLMNAQASSI